MVVVDTPEKAQAREDAVAPSGLVLLHSTQVSIEKTRIAVGNRVSALERDADFATSDIGQLYFELRSVLEGWEERIEDAMAREAQWFPVYTQWLCHVKGIGPGLASQLLAMLKPPLADRGPSTWFKAAGLTVEWVTEDGKLADMTDPDFDPEDPRLMRRLPRARTGREGLPYYPRLRRTLFNVATSFVRVGGYYRQVYVERKLRLVDQHAGDRRWPSHRLDAVARWLMVKLFLSHLYEKWLETEGLESRKPYVVEYLGHHYIAPPEWDGNGKI